MGFKRHRVWIIAMLLIPTFLVPLETQVAHASGHVYINPSYLAPTAPGTKFNVTIQVANIDPYNGWDIMVKTDASVVNPTNISIQGDALVRNYGMTLLQAANCVNNGAGILNDQPGNSGCNSSIGDGLGVAHSGVVAFMCPNNPCITPPDTSGLLFTVTYVVVGPGLYSAIQLSSVTITNGTTSPVVVSGVGGSYGTQTRPDFSIAAQSSVNVTQGQSANVTIRLDSINGFSGLVNLTGTSDVSGLKLSLPPNLNLSSSPLYVVLIITTSSSTNLPSYTVTVTGTSSTLSHEITLNVYLPIPADFILSASPSLLLISATNTGTSTIILQSTYHFSGNITLSLQGPQNVSFALDRLNVLLTPDSTQTSTLKVTTPPSNLPFLYTITITANSTRVTGSPKSIEVKVQPPHYDVQFTIAPSSVTLKPGGSTLFNVTLTSQYYFKGTVYLFSSAVTGRLILTPSKAPLSFGNTTYASLALSIDSATNPGVYLIFLRIQGYYFTSTLTPINDLANVTLYVSVQNAPLQSVTKTIFGLQPALYFGMIGTLALILVMLTLREAQRPRQRSSLLTR